MVILNIQLSFKFSDFQRYFIFDLVLEEFIRYIKVIRVEYCFFKMFKLKEKFMNLWIIIRNCNLFEFSVDLKDYI